MQPFLLRDFLGNLEMKNHGQNLQETCASVMKLIQDGVIKLPSGRHHMFVTRHSVPSAIYPVCLSRVHRMIVFSDVPLLFWAEQGKGTLWKKSS